MGPRVAVVIPTYNRANRIVATVESVLQQGPALGRVIVVDDGSTDDTVARLAPFGDRIELLSKINGERGAARNAGARLAAEPYVCFLDSDDRILPGHLQAALDQLAVDSDAAAVYSDILLEDDAGRTVGQRRGARALGFRGGEPVTSLIAGYDNCQLAQGALVYRHDAFDAVGGFREPRELAGSEDFELNVRLLARSRFAPSGSLTFGYRVHEGNTFGSIAQSTRCIRASVAFIESDPDLARFASLFPRMRAFAELQLAAVHLGADDFDGCRQRLADAVAATTSAVVGSRRFAEMAFPCPARCPRQSAAARGQAAPARPRAGSIRPPVSSKPPMVSIGLPRLQRRAPLADGHRVAAGARLRRLRARHLGQRVDGRDRGSCAVRTARARCAHSLRAPAVEPRRHLELQPRRPTMRRRASSCGPRTTIGGAATSSPAP